MKAKIKLCNDFGNSTIEEYKSIADLKVFLNSCLYYSGEVYLNVPSVSNYVRYSKTDDVASLVRDVKFYNDDYLEVIQTYEDPDEDNEDE